MVKEGFAFLRGEDNSRPGRGKEKKKEEKKKKKKNKKEKKKEKEEKKIGGEKEVDKILVVGTARGAESAEFKTER